MNSFLMPTGCYKFRDGAVIEIEVEYYINGYTTREWILFDDYLNNRNFKYNAYKYTTR